LENLTSKLGQPDNLEKLFELPKLMQDLSAMDWKTEQVFELGIGGNQCKVFSGSW